MKKELKYIGLNNFTTESGYFYSNFELSYQLFGQKLFTAPIVLVNHALTGNSNVAGEFGWWSSLIGLGKLIDTNKFTVIAFNIPGNGYDEKTSFPDGDVRNRYFRGNNLKAVVKKVEEIKKYKEENLSEYSMAELALKFCLSNNAVTTVIPGIRNVDQAIKNTSVSDGNYLSNEELKELEKYVWRKDFWFNEVELK